MSTVTNPYRKCNIPQWQYPTALRDLKQLIVISVRLCQGVVIVASQDLTMNGEY